ncbi:hypothetical protein PR202_ga00393 [Eleusine coracana subsp. coracana]|uniref:CCHC-type domain-containing protein n=1 Tax=Eleusine coracana subsp. coracana TaxID=191504 RepID=A0AAV5BGE4_ELECO|nr:hypothetical protein PR202_ga00393 [Eleusine coracana subsp. coracana]
MTRILAKGVTANVMVPGPVRTELFLAEKDEAFLRRVAKQSMGRIAETADVAPVVAFLVSDAPGGSKVQEVLQHRKERRGGGLRTCFECGGSEHFIVDCPKKKKKVRYHDNNTEDFKQKKNRFYKKDKNSKKFAKAIARACVAALSDVDLTSSEALTSSEEEVEKPRVKRKDDFTGLCFMAKNDHDTDSSSDSDTSEVPPTLDELSSELDYLRDVLLMQDE